MPSRISMAHAASPRDGMAPRQPKSALLSLPQDLVSLILTWLDDIDHASVSNAALVCSALYGKARYAQHQAVWINVEAAELTLQRLRWVTQAGLLPAIRALHVTVPDHIHLPVDTPPPDGPGPASDELAAWTLLLRLLPRMSGLRHLHWVGIALPEAVVQQLAGNPQISLHLSLHATDRQSHLPERLAHLNLLNELPARIEPAVHTLSSLHVGLTYGSPDLARPIMQTALKQLLLAHRGLRVLSLDVAYAPEHVVVRDANGRDPFRRQYCGFGFTGAEAPAAALESLTITRYPWGLPDADPDPDASLVFPNTAGYPNPQRELDDWPTRLDWSRLRCLRLHGMHTMLFTTLAPHLCALEELHLVCGAADAATGACLAAAGLAAAYLTALPAAAGLRALTVPRLYPFADNEDAGLATLVGHLGLHAATLRELVVHPVPVGAADLERLRGVLPGVEKLRVVCEREGDGAGDGEGDGAWPADVWPALAAFREMRELTVVFDVGSPGRPATPAVTAVTAREVARGIWRLMRRGGGGALRKVTVRSEVVVAREEFWKGDDEEGVWNKDHTVAFECVLRGDGAGDAEGEVEVDVSCLGFSSVRNIRLREIVAARVAGGKGELTDEEEGDIPFLIALDGPIRMDMSSPWKEAMIERLVREHV